MLDFSEHNGSHGRKKCMVGWDMSHLLIEPLAPGTTDTQGSEYGIRAATETSQPTRSDLSTLSLLQARKGFYLPE